MKRISKTCKSMKEAEDIQDSLYDEYSSVQLVVFPSFSEDGLYVWEVK